MPTKKNIKSPEHLYELFQKYEKHAKNSPKRAYHYSTKLDKQVAVDKEIPLTWTGFEVFLNKSKVISRLDDYKANKDDRYSEYAYIIRAIDLEIKDDKFSGAAAGVYQHNIIARDLGMVDKKDFTTDGKPIQPITGIEVK